MHLGVSIPVYGCDSCVWLSISVYGCLYFSSGSAEVGAALSSVYSPNVYFCRTPGWLAVHRGVPNPLQPAQSNSPSGPREAAPPRQLCKPSLPGSSLPFCASPPPALDHPIPAEITNTQTHRHVVRQTASQAQGTAKTGTFFPSLNRCGHMSNLPAGFQQHSTPALAPALRSHQCIDSPLRGGEYT